LTLRIDSLHVYASQGLVPVARSARGTPIVSVTDTPGRRAVVVSFGPGDSNLPAAPGFPVLVGNALDWIARPDGRPGVRPGPVTFDGSVTKVTGPRNSTVALAHVNGAAFGVLREPGLYTAEAGAGRSAVAVNAGDPQVSNVSRTTLGPAAHALPVAPGGGAHPWWLYCAAAAFALTVAEWWTWQRRITV
jgi:hypothetical protein